MKFEIPKKVELDVFLFINLDNVSNCDNFYDCTSILKFDPSHLHEGKQYLTLSSQLVKFEIDSEFDIRGATISKLEEQKNDIMAEYHMKLKNIDEKIANLNAITYKKESANDSF